MGLITLAREFLQFCYPGRCARCGEDAQTTLCDACDEQLEQLSAAGRCGRCAMPLAQADAPCPHCMGRGRSPLDRVVRLGTFDEPIKSLVHQFKYHRQWVLGEMLAERLASREDAAALLAAGEVIVPVPLHYLRQLSRGYNQAEVIARRLSRRCGKPVAHVVRRVRNTQTQTHLHSRARRIANLRDAFELTAPDHIDGKHVVLVDDVMTTGATLQSVARTLKQAKPAGISAIVLAIADPKHSDFQTK